MAQPVLVTSYESPDMDGLACAVAYTEYLNTTGTKAVTGITGDLHGEAQYVVDRFRIRLDAVSDIDQYDRFILVDTSNLEAIDKRIDPSHVIEIIDHRKVHQADKFLNAKVQIELVGSASTLITEKFHVKEIRPTKQSATLLYAAIISNTLNFMASVTTPRDRAMAKWLNEELKLPESFAKDMFTAKSDLRDEKLKQMIVGDFIAYTLEDTPVGIAQLEIVGADELVATRMQEMLDELHLLMKQQGLSMIFLSVIDLEKGWNIFVTDHTETQKMLETIFHVTFTDSRAVKEGPFMRKEIWPKVKQYVKS